MASTTLRTALDLERMREIFEAVLRVSPAQETEAMIQATASELTRFANNVIHQNVAEERVALSVRTVINGRMARASTNRLDDDSIRRVVESAIALTKLQQPDPDALPMPGPETMPSVDRFHEATAAITPGDRARAVRQMVEIAGAEKLTTAGIYSNSISAFGLFNSRGLEAFYRDTSAEYSVTMLGGDSSGWAKGNSPDVRPLRPEDGARIAARKARASTSPIELPPGKYTVILEPAAVLDLLGFIFWDFGGLALLDQRSFLTGRFDPAAPSAGRPLFGENIHIRDDVYHPLQSGAPFDGEGVPRRRVPLIENGRVVNVVYARQTAVRMRREVPGSHPEPTGHGFPLPNEYGEAPLNIVVEGGTSPIDDMIAAADRAILVTRLWYIREVDPYQKILTGMTRDGTFLVENGRVTRGLRNFRFNQSMVELLNNVQVMGAPVRASGEESFDMVVPPMVVRDFNFTEVTKF
jgi:PmbA protein